MSLIKKIVVGFSLIICFGQTYGFGDSSVSVMLNGAPFHTEAPALIESGRTMLPMRSVFETFGFSVNWNDMDRSITAKKDSYQVELKAGSNVAKVNETSSFLDVPPSVIAGSTYVPLRFVAESIGAEVNWNQDLKRVEITTIALDKPVTFADFLLADTFKKRLNKDSFKVRDFYYMTRLDLKREGIYKLDGIEAFKNLQILDLSENNITFLDPIAKLGQLTELKAASNQIGDLKPLKELKNLRTLDIYSNKVWDFSPLSDIATITTLKITNNKGDDYSPLYYSKGQYKVLDVPLNEIEIPKYNTATLRYDANFIMPVTDKVSWVPAASVSGIGFTNEELYNLRVAGPEGEKNHLKSLYDALRYLQLNAVYKYEKNAEVVKEPDNGRMWYYPLDGYNSLRVNQGDQFALAQTLAYLLKNDYQETGFLIVLKSDGSRLLLNYLRSDRAAKEKDQYDRDVYVNYPEYYVVNYEAYRNGSLSPAAKETGNQVDFAKSNPVSNVLKVQDLKDYAEFAVKTDPKIGAIIKLRDDSVNVMVVPIAEYGADAEASLKTIRILPKSLQDPVTYLYRSESNPIPIGFAEAVIPAPDFSKLPTFDYRLYTK